MYVDNVSPFITQQGNKDECLNRLVQELYEKCEAKIQSKMDNIKKLKDQVRDLESDAENAEFGDEDDVDEDGKKIKRKPRKDKMCKKYLDSFYDEKTLKERESKGLKKVNQGLEGHKVPWHCKGIKDKTCKFAHNPLDLNALKVSGEPKVKKSNLQTVI